MPPAVTAAVPPAAAKLDLKNDRRSRSSVSLNSRWCNSNSGQFLSSPAHIVSLSWFEHAFFRPTPHPISVHRNSQTCARCYVLLELSPKVGDVGNREGGISWGCLTPPLLHRRSDMPCPRITSSSEFSQESLA